MAQFEILKSYESSFGRFDVYERFMVGTLVSDVDRRKEALFEWVGDFISSEFNEPWGYVGNRVNKNASDPSFLVKAREKYPLWCSFAVVSRSMIAAETFALESMALGDFPSAIFEDLNSAMIWTDEKVLAARGRALR